MSDFATAWRSLNFDPRFTSLSYAEQQELRAKWLQRNAPKSERFMQLSQPSQQRVFEQMVTQPPTFGEKTETIEETLQRAQGVRLGDFQALRDASTQIAGYKATNMAGPIHKLASSIGEAFLPEDQTLAPTEAGGDEEKAINYLEQEFQRSDDKTFWQGALANIAPFVGLAANLASGRVAAQPGLAATRAAGTRGLLFNRSGQATAATQQITGSMGSSLAAGKMGATRFGRWVGQSVIPELFESGVDATMLATGDYLSDRLHENAPFGIEAKSEFGQLATNFGLDFVGDMVFFGTANLLGSMFKAGLKVARFRGFEPKAAKVMSDADFDVLNDSLYSGREVPKAVWVNLPGETQKTFQRLRRAFSIKNDLPNASPNDIARATALKNGYDMVPAEGGGINVRAIAGDDFVPGTFTNEQKALRGLVEHNMQPPEQATKMVDAVVQNEAGVSRLARFQIGDKLPEFDERTVARTLTPGEGGRINPKPIRTALQSNLQRSGASADMVKNVDVKTVPADAYWKMSNNARVQNNRVYVPDVVRTSDDMTRFINKFTQDAQKLVPKDAAARLANYINDAAEAIPTVKTSTNPMFVEVEALRHKIPYEALPNGTYRVGNETVGSLQEAGESVHKQSLFQSQDNLREAYSYQYGFAFKQAKDGRWHARGKQVERGGNVLTGNHETLEGAADELWGKGFKPRLSQDSAANVIITPDGTKVEIHGKGEAISGPLEYIRDYAQQYFTKFDEAAILRRYGNDTIAKGRIENVFRVTSPEWGYIDEFTSYKEANEFLTKTRNTVEDLLEVGMLKGVPDIQVNGGRIVARPVDGPQVDFQTVDELRSWLKAKTPSPAWTKEVSNMDASMVDSVWEQVDPELRQLYTSRSGMSQGNTNFGKVLDHMKEDPKWRVGGQAPANAEYGKGIAAAYAGTGFAQFVKDFLQTPMYARTRRIVGQTGRDVLGTSFEAMEKSLKNSKAIQAQTSELLHGITSFKGAPKRKRRALLRPLLEVDPGTWQAKAKAWNIDLNDNDIRFMQRYRKASDTLGQSLGIDPYRMISFHLPRIRSFMADNPDIVAGATYAREILGKMDAKLANELEFFSEFLRADELSTFVNSTDPMDLLASYTRKGVKNMTLGATYKSMKSKFDGLVAAKEITDQEAYTFFHYLEQMMGMYSDEATKAAAHSARETTRILAKRLGAKKNIAGFGDYINVMHGLTIAATMSFRPWPVLRNMMQPWTTLAPIFGNDSVMRATKVMADDKQAGEVWTRLHKSGRLQSKIPVYGGVYEATGKLGLANKFGMKWYKNSDDYTRMLTDVVVRDTFTDAVAKLEAGVVNEKQFIRLANLHRLDDFDQQEVVKRLAGYVDAEGKQIAGSFENAVDYYGDVVTRETMFAYTAGANALAFQGMWGRLFGMFGHWPTFYAQTLANGLRRGNMMDKAVFAGRVVANAAALTFAFEDVAGIRADNFKPHKMMFFGGGPYFSLISDSLDAASGGYGGSTFGGIKRDMISLFVPGSLMAKSAAQGIDLMARGETYDGLLRLMSAPLADD